MSLRKLNTQDNAVLILALGNMGDEPIAGDFNADAQADIYKI